MNLLNYPSSDTINRIPLVVLSLSSGNPSTQCKRVTDGYRIAQIFSRSTNKISSIASIGYERVTESMSYISDFEVLSHEHVERGCCVRPGGAEARAAVSQEV